MQSDRFQVARRKTTGACDKTTSFGPGLPFVFLFLFRVFAVIAQNNGTPELLISYIENAPEIVSTAAVLLDTSTGTALYAKNPDLEIPPASLTKLMTMHLVMNEVEAGRAFLDEMVTITKESWAQSQPPRSSLMFLAPGQIVTLREIMLGLAVSSGNDAAVAAALRFAPGVQDFAAIMTEEARRMGLSVTRFTEPSGISEDNMTTAAECADFCRQYITLHPRALREFHSVPVFAYPKAENVPAAFRNNPNTIVQYNRNNFLKDFPGADGLKTGYIDEAGYNISLTAERGHTRFLLVILGAPAHTGGDLIRDADARRLLSWAFDNFKTLRPDIPAPDKVRLWKGRADDVEIKLAASPDFTSPVNRGNYLHYNIQTERLIAPVHMGQHTGWLIISDDIGEIHRIELVSVQNYDKGNIFKRIFHTLVLFFKNL
ncbi:MAG: D-alanyl-D-alanine carboxypeptidase [Treponema sp.]|nr:D-alanyl-D-alanine carboxypeptidase [Treponema sp.]